MDISLDSAGKKTVLLTSLSFIVSLIFLRLSSFSVSSVVNFYNHIIKSVIFSASTNTFAALSILLRPFAFVFISLVFLALGIAILAFYGGKNKSGQISGAVSAAVALVLFPTVAGVFLAVAFFLCSYAGRFSDMYAREIKKWAGFRIGSNTAGKMLMIVNVLIALGVFSSVLLAQAQYEASFRNELKESVRALALSLPGSSAMPPDVLEQRIESTTASLAGSNFFSAYIVWLPVSVAFTAWILLELLRNLVLANMSGLFTYAMFRKSG